MLNGMSGLILGNRAAVRTRNDSSTTSSSTRSSGRARANAMLRKRMATSSADNMTWGSAKNTETLYASAEPTGGSSVKEEFYHFLINNKISAIIDLRPDTSIDAANRYYPESTLADSLSYGDISVHAKAVDNHSMIRTVTLEIRSHSACRRDSDALTHEIEVSHFLGWKDFSTINPDDLKQLGERLIRNAELSKNNLVHCRGGVGRTGTLITYAQVKRALQSQHSREKIPLDQIEKMVERQIDANRRVRLAGCIETPGQHELVVETLKRDHN
ncbi:MAG: protein-tyrosine phosphatase family protein [Gammaproteobacteria bacterium]